MTHEPATIAAIARTIQRPAPSASPTPSNTAASTSPTRATPDLPATVSAFAALVRARQGDFAEFNQLHSYARAADLERKRQRGDDPLCNAFTMMLPTAPTIAVLAEAYGTDAQEAYLFQTIFAHQELLAPRDKMDDFAIHGVAQAVALAWGRRVKVDEWLCFLARDRGGIYGPVYGAYTPAAITDHLATYWRTEGRRWREWVIEQVRSNPERRRQWYE